MVNSGKDEKNMVQAIKNLDNSFDPIEEMMPAQTLRRKSFNDIQKHLEHVKKICITLRGEPQSVILPYKLYRELIKYLHVLEERLEENKAYETYGERLETSEALYLDEEDFKNAISSIKENGN